MTAFYVRWGVVLLISWVLVFLTQQNYELNLASLSPQEVLASNLSGELRVLGLVKSGSLTGNIEAGEAEFDLAGLEQDMSVTYKGPPPENLRELKHLIVIGTWNSQAQRFFAREFGLVTNYGFVLGAYVIGLLPLAMFLFMMGRKVTMLFDEIKQSKLYEAE
ncbi:MAG: cytochrome c maturation protein CcmE [Nitrospirae bacterium]|nr:cytochrome c maturation protein CcmE [Nitrospirota bacterium]